MNKSIRLLTLAATMLAILSSLGCSKLRARDQLNKGVTAFKNAKFEEATASCDSKQADFIRLYLSGLDEECTKATGMQFALVTQGTYSWFIPHMIFVIICRHEGYRKAM